MSQSKKRRKWSAAKKLEIVMAGMEAGAEISELCRREGLSPTQYYSWKKQLLGSAEAVFGTKGNGKQGESKPDPKEQELTRMRAVIAEITAENLELKKTL
jgi:transposase-like protein